MNLLILEALFVILLIICNKKYILISFYSYSSLEKDIGRNKDVRNLEIILNIESVEEEMDICPRQVSKIKAYHLREREMKSLRTFFDLLLSFVISFYWPIKSCVKCSLKSYDVIKRNDIETHLS